MVLWENYRQSIFPKVRKIDICKILLELALILTNGVHTRIFVTHEENKGKDIWEIQTF